MTDEGFSPGIGDSWSLVIAPDERVATIDEHLRNCAQPGCTGQLDETITAVGPGTTTIELRYCFRSAPPNCQPQPGETLAEPVTVVVEVA